MQTITRVLVLFVFYAMCFGANADVLDDVLRQSGGVVVDSERNKSAKTIDGERKKKAIEADAVRQINLFAELIEKNDYRVNNELEPQIDDIRSDLRILERDRVDGVISWNTYVSEKRKSENRMSGVRNTIANLKRQNTEYLRRQTEARTIAEDKKRQVDIDVQNTSDRVDDNRKKTIIDKIIQEMKR